MRGQVSIEPVVASSSDSIGVRNHPLKGGKITAHRPQAKKSSHDDVTSGNDFKLGQSRDFRLVPATPGYLVERTSHDNVSSQATDKNRVIGKTLPVPQNSASATTTNLLPSEDDTSSSLQSYQQFVRAGCAAPKRQDPPVGLMDLVQKSKSFDSTTSLHDTVPSIRSSTTGLKSPSLIQSVDTRAKNKPSDHGLLSKVVTAEASNPSPSAKSSTTEAADEHGASDNSEDYRSGSSCEGSPSGHGSPRGSGQGSPIGSGQESPRGSGQASPLTSPPKKLTWGKAKSYPGSETVSDLEDDKTSENRSNLQQAKKKLVAVPKGSAKGKNVDKTHMYPPKDKRGKRMNKRSSSKRRLGRDE